MTLENKKIEVTKVYYESSIEQQKGLELAIITAVIDIVVDNKYCFAASLRVDGHELLPSDRIDVTAGKNTVRLKPVKIVNPRRAGKKTDGIYKMLLTLTCTQNQTLNICTDFSLE